MGCYLCRCKSSEKEFLFYLNSKSRIYVTKSSFSSNLIVNKFVDKNNTFYNEINILKKLSNNNNNKTIKLIKFNFFKKKEGGIIYYNYINGYSLFDYISEYYVYNGNISPKIIFRSILNCIKYIHSLGIIHMDIKPENFVCYNNNPYNIKLIDFGVSIDNNKRKNYFSEQKGTIPYMAPEVINNKAYFNSDVWSLACTMYPFYNKNISFLIPCSNFGYIISSEFYLTNKILDSINDNIIDDNLKNLFFRMLSINPCDRISIDNIYNHLYFN